MAVQTVSAPSVWPPGSNVSITGQVVAGDGHLVGGIEAHQFGTLTIREGVRFTVNGVASAQQFGAVTPKSVFVRAVNGVSSAQAFGVPTRTMIIRVAVPGVASAQQFGGLKTQARFVVLGLGSAQQFGAPIAQTRITVTIGAVASAQSFGAVTTRTGFTKQVAGLASAQAFGAITVVYLVSAPGLASAQQFGAPRTNLRFTVAGLSSAQQFGVADLRAVNVWLHPSDCLLEDLDPAICLPSVGGSICGQVICGDGHLVGGWSYLAGSVERDLLLVVASQRTLTVFEPPKTTITLKPSRCL